MSVWKDDPIWCDLSYAWKNHWRDAFCYAGMVMAAAALARWLGWW